MIHNETVTDIAGLWRVEVSINNNKKFWEEPYSLHTLIFRHERCYNHHILNKFKFLCQHVLYFN